jgi:hypothetical protein
MPLATPEVDPEKMVRNGKTPQEGTSISKPGISKDFHCPSLETQISSSHYPIIMFVGVFRILKFGSVSIEFSPPGLDLEVEILVTPLSSEVVPWSRP